MELLCESMVPGFCFVHILIDLSNTRSHCTVGARTPATKHVVSSQKCKVVTQPFPSLLTVLKWDTPGCTWKCKFRLFGLCFLIPLQQNWGWVWTDVARWPTPKMCAKGHLQHFSGMCVGTQLKQGKCQECSWSCPSYSRTFAPHSYSFVVTEFS